MRVSFRLSSPLGPRPQVSLLLTISHSGSPLRFSPLHLLLIILFSPFFSPLPPLPCLHFSRLFSLSNLGFSSSSSVDLAFGGNFEFQISWMICDGSMAALGGWESRHPQRLVELCFSPFLWLHPLLWRFPSLVVEICDSAGGA